MGPAIGSLATGASMLESMFLGPEEEEGRFGVNVDSNVCGGGGLVCGGVAVQQMRMEQWLGSVAMEQNNFAPLSGVRLNRLFNKLLLRAFVRCTF